jgi:hypothetical protein
MDATAHAGIARTGETPVSLIGVFSSCPGVLAPLAFPFHEAAPSVLDVPGRLTCWWDVEIKMKKQELIPLFRIPVLESVEPLRVFVTSRFNPLPEVRHATRFRRRRHAIA